MLDVLGTADTVGTESEVGRTEVDQEGGEEVMGGNSDLVQVAAL